MQLEACIWHDVADVLHKSVWRSVSYGAEYAGHGITAGPVHQSTVHEIDVGYE